MERVLKLQTLFNLLQGLSPTLVKLSIEVLPPCVPLVSVDLLDNQPDYCSLNSCCLFGFFLFCFCFVAEHAVSVWGSW